MTATCSYVSEPSVHHSLVDREVDDGLLLSVIDTCESSLLGLSLNDLNLLHDVCREVLCRELRVVEEECLSVDGDLLDGLTVRCDSTVRCHFHSRKLLQEIFEHIVVRSLE